jgi:CheY-like chemotaxis protein
MVVDDTESIRQSLSKLLRLEGCDVVTAGSGREAMHELETSVPDLVLLDVMMPEMDGMQFLEILRGHPIWRELPVIMVSALSDPRRIHRAKQLGAKEYLIKAGLPVTQLLHLIKQHANFGAPCEACPQEAAH